MPEVRSSAGSYCSLAARVAELPLRVNPAISNGTSVLRFGLESGPPDPRTNEYTP